MTFCQVTLLGTKGGPAIRPGSPMPTATLIQMDGKTILVDAGLGAARAVCDAGVALVDIDAIVITHLHSDHYLELGPLLHTAWTAGLTAPIPVFGPSGLQDYWRNFLQSMAFDIDLRQRDEGRPPLAKLVQIKPLSETVQLGSITMRTMQNVHPPVDETYALRFEGSRAVTLSGDTAPMPEMVNFAQGSDLLIHEAMLTAGIDMICERVGNGDDRLRIHLERSHAPAHDVGQIATDAAVGHLALNHLVPCDLPEFTENDWEREVRRTWAGPLDIGRDGLTIPLDERREQ
ncbi:MAG: MBL fold metallo-hydrolase [Pseudomonadota bacterium]